METLSTSNRNDTNKINKMFIYSFLCILLGMKLLLIQYAGFPQPVWDQWDAQAFNLYIPYLEGNLTIQSLLEPHNEHRIFTTRILSLGLLLANDQWDPILEMVINSFLHISSLLIFVKVIYNTSNKKYASVAFFIGSLIWMLPFGWDNAVSGFQSQFYFLLIFSFSSLYLITQHNALTKYWVIGLILSLCAIFSMASGSIIYVAIIVYIIFSMLYHRKKTSSDIITLVTCVVIFFVALSITPKIEGHEPLKAQSVYAFLQSFFSATAWPFISVPPLAIVVWSPAIIWLLTKLKSKERLTAFECYLILVSLWVLLQAAAFAYSRGASGTMPVSKYMDILLISPLLNALFLIRTLDLFAQLEKCYSIKKRYLAFSWFFLIVVGLIALLGKYTIPGIKEQKHYGEIQLSIMKEYVYSNNTSVLLNKPFRHIPYPDANRMISILENPKLRSILPAQFSNIGDITDLSDSKGFVIDGFYPFVGKNNSEPSIGSYGADGDSTTGEYRSQLFQSTAKYIEIPFSGYLGEKGITAYIEMEDGQKIELGMKHLAKEKWKRLLVDNPKKPFRISILDSSPKFWVAMSTPKSVGQFSYLAAQLVDHSKQILLLGLIILLWHFGPRSLQKLEQQ